jgi:uncharacterized protein YuzE
MEQLKKALLEHREQPYNFHEEISEILTPKDGKVCGFECTKEMLEFLQSDYRSQLIETAKRYKKALDRSKIHKGQWCLF